LYRDFPDPSAVRKQFFFEKKNQKLLSILASAFLAGPTRLPASLD